MKRFNALTGDLDHESDRDGYRWRGVRGIGERLGAERIGASLYELEAGELTFPYHHPHGIEEWLYVIAGSPAVRTPAGERLLQSGDLICFPTASARRLQAALAIRWAIRGIGCASARCSRSRCPCA